MRTHLAVAGFAVEDDQSCTAPEVHMKSSLSGTAVPFVADGPSVRKVLGSTMVGYENDQGCTQHDVDMEPCLAGIDVARGVLWLRCWTMMISVLRVLRAPFLNVIRTRSRTRRKRMCVHEWDEAAHKIRETTVEVIQLLNKFAHTIDTECDRWDDEGGGAVLRAHTIRAKIITEIRGADLLFRISSNL